MMGGQITAMAVYEVPVIRTRSPYEAISATGLKQHIDHGVIVSMPNGKGDKVKVYLFRPGRFLTSEKLEMEYAERRLVPADPYLLAALNEANSGLIDIKPNATHWVGKNGKWCSATFYKETKGDRCVCIVQNDVGWEDTMWYAGVVPSEEDKLTS